eukprot:PhF_6_TR25735/c0_g1_i1/m.36270
MKKHFRRICGCCFGWEDSEELLMDDPTLPPSSYELENKLSLNDANVRLNECAKSYGLHKCAITKNGTVLEIEGPFPSNNDQTEQCVDDILTIIAEDMEFAASQNITDFLLKDCDLTSATNTILEEVLSHIPSLHTVHLTKCELPGLFCITVDHIKLVRCRIREVHVHALSRWVEGGGVKKTLVLQIVPSSVSEDSIDKLREACAITDVKLTVEFIKT